MTDTIDATGVTEQTRRADFTAGLRALADWYDAHPDVPLPYEAISPLSILISGDDDQLTEVGRIARAMGTCDKVVTAKFFRVTKSFGPVVKLEVVADRDQVCERVVTGVETVTELVPDPAAPLVEQTVEREIVEWQCPESILRASA
jgi:hypothetical protein